MGLWDPTISIQTFAYPTLCKDRKGWGTRRLVALPALPNRKLVSSRKVARVDLSRVAQQEIRVRFARNDKVEAALHHGIRGGGWAGPAKAAPHSYGDRLLIVSETAFIGNRRRLAFIAPKVGFSGACKFPLFNTRQSSLKVAD
jgi:hypothetical protein